MDDIDKITAELYQATKPKKHIKVKTSREKARNDYKKLKRLHRRHIKALKADIRRHRLLIKQAKTTYRIVKG